MRLGRISDQKNTVAKSIKSRKCLWLGLMLVMRPAVLRWPEKEVSDGFGF